MTRPRDSQRAKLYAAEAAALGIHRDNALAGRHIPDIHDVDDYLVKLVNSAWFKRRWGAGVYANQHHRSFRTVARRGARGGMHVVQLPRWARHEAMILHEFAHHIVERSNGYGRTAWHGWEFCAVLLELIEHQLGAEAGAQLKAAYKTKGVRHRKPVKRQLTEAQRQVLRDRLAAVRSAKVAA